MAVKLSLTDTSIYWLTKLTLVGMPTFILLAAVISLIFVFNDRRRRQIRADIQSFMQKEEQVIPGLAEEVLATQISDHLVKDDFDALRSVSIAPYVSIHYRDVMFKRRVYDCVVARLLDSHYRSEVRNYALIAASVDAWRSQATSYNDAMVENVKRFSATQKSGKWIEKFLTKRPAFFTTI
jgi:hypothetical protein